MRTWMIAGCLLAGCSFHANEGAKDASVHLDGPPDTTIVDAADASFDGPPPDAQQCFGSGGWTVCLAALPTDPVTLPGTIDTSDGSMACNMAAPSDWLAANQPDACFIVGTTISSGGGTTKVTGTRPLVLVATDTITISKLLDVASHRGAMPGPYADYLQCSAFGANPGNSSSGGGGGAGGSFTTKGGDGGDGDNGNASKGQAGPALSTTAMLHGGCPGQSGGNGTQPPGLAGSGGGAVYLVAGNKITISNAIDASGAGAAKGGHASGGSGGGSGGMIVLYAPTIDATGVIIADGGGGASGGDASGGGHDGKDGGDPSVATPIAAAPGGVGPGGNGGDGSLQDSQGSPGTGGNSNQGGGGGGGGAGYIRANVALTGATVSPTATIVP